MPTTLPARARPVRLGLEIARGLSSLLYSRTRVPRPMRPLTLSLSPSGGEGIETAPSPSERERVGVRVAHAVTHSPGLEPTPCGRGCEGSGTALTSPPSRRRRLRPRRLMARFPRAVPARRLDTAFAGDVSPTWGLHQIASAIPCRGLHRRQRSRQCGDQRERQRDDERSPANHALWQDAREGSGP